MPVSLAACLTFGVVVLGVIIPFCDDYLLIMFYATIRFTRVLVPIWLCTLFLANRGTLLSPAPFLVTIIRWKAFELQ